jgi:SAM-dependent methyltransferase
MDTTHQTEHDQSALWNERAGNAWVDAQETLDQMFEPFEDLLVETVLSRPRRTVLDVGCGTGGTTIAAARALGPDGRTTGIDIAEPMLAAARRRAERLATPPRFILADAQVHEFGPASFDAIISRFGVMFFDDPVHAFANLRRAAASGAALRFIAWRSALENPFMTTAERAAAPLLPSLPIRQPDEPGQFGFADRKRVHAILKESGWSSIDIRPIDVECSMPEKSLRQYAARFGPVGRVLHEMDEQTRDKVIDAVRAAFDPFVHGTDVRFTAACWLADATAPRMAE